MILHSLEKTKAHLSSLRFQGIPKKIRIIFIRLSSLGDLLICADSVKRWISSLPPDFQKRIELIWITDTRFEEIVTDALGDCGSKFKIIPFNRTTGLKGWLTLIKKQVEIQTEDFAPELKADLTLIIDLHRSLRTSVGKIFIRSVIGCRRPNVKIYSIEKQKIRFYGLMIFKKAFPVRLYPYHLSKKIDYLFNRVDKDFSQFFKGVGFTSVVDQSTASPVKIKSNIPTNSPEMKSPYYCLMPASRWRSKEWSVEKWLELISLYKKTYPNYHPRIVGLSSDPIILELRSRLLRRDSSRSRQESNALVLSKRVRQNRRQEEVESLALSLDSDLNDLFQVDLDWKQTKNLLQGAVFFIGGDTGLSHLSGLLNVPTIVIRGPTIPEQGFAVQGNKVAEIGADLWCRPCGKDGRFCYRLLEKRKCLELVQPEFIVERTQSLII